MDDILTFDALVEALEKIRGDCDHTPAYYVNEYWMKCECGMHDYLIAPADLREWYSNILNNNTNSNTNIEKICGIDIVRSEKSML